MLTPEKIYTEYSNPYDKIQLNWRQYLDLRDLHLSFLIDSITILDAGTGTGNQAVELVKAGKFVYAIDTSEYMMNYLCKKISKGAPNLIILLMDIERLGFGDKVFDAVTAMNTIYNAREPETALRECHRVLKKGGLFSLSGPLPTANIDAMADHAIAEMQQKGLYDREVRENIEIMRQMNYELMKRAKFYKASQLEQILIGIGFRNIIHTTEEPYLGNAYFVVARK